MTTLSEELAFIDELVTVFAQESQKLGDQSKETSELLTKIKEMRTRREDNIKQTITELISECSEEETELNQGKQESTEQEQSMAALEQELNEAKLQKDNLIVEKKTLDAELQNCEDVKMKTISQRQEIKENTAKILPALRYDVNLFTHITNIRWQYDTSPEEIKGFVCNTKNAKPFSLNTKQNSEYFTVNYLWDLMEADW